MPKLRVQNTEIYYEEQGQGQETIVFAHGLLWSGRMFDDQVLHLRSRYRCITFDFRGQGRSDIAEDGYDMDTLTADAVALIEHLGVGPCHFAGLSMGGFIGLRLASRHPDLLRSLVLLETSADPEPEANQKRYRTLNFIARWFGLGVVSRRVMPIMFGRKFLDDPARAELRKTWRRRMIANHRVGITRAVTGVIERQGVANQLANIRVPTLILVGDQDTATPVDKSERMHQGIAGSELMIIPGAGHTSTVEEPAFVNQALDVFLNKLQK